MLLSSGVPVWADFAPSFAPSEEEHHKLKEDHPELNLLDGMPCAMELILYLEWTTRGTSLLSLSCRLPSALKKFYRELARVHSDELAPTRAGIDKTQECVKLLEKLNSEINEILGRETLGFARSRSEQISRNAVEQKDAEEEVAQESSGAVPLPERSITLDCAISTDENKTFIAMFRIAKATPRKMKRVVNV